MSHLYSYYDILKISKQASEDEITSSFRKLTKIYHPDLHNNSPEANITFITIKNAYEILKDAKKRHEYDMFLYTHQSQSEYKSHNISTHNISYNNNTAMYSLMQIFSHLNHVIWDIELFMQNEFKKYYNRDFSGTSLKQYILKILIFIDKWILLPTGNCDYFMTARKKKPLTIDEYAHLIESKNSSVHKPFYNIANYFYDIRKRIDTVLNKTTITDLSSNIEGYNLRLIDCIIETQNFTLHYLGSITHALQNNSQNIEPFIFSNPCFK